MATLYDHQVFTAVWIQLPAEPPSRLNSRLNPDFVFNPLPRFGDYHVTVAVLYSGLYRPWLHSQLNQPPYHFTKQSSTQRGAGWPGPGSLKIDDAETSFASTDDTPRSYRFRCCHA